MRIAISTSDKSLYGGLKEAKIDGLKVSVKNRDSIERGELLQLTVSVASSVASGAIKLLAEWLCKKLKNHEQQTTVINGNQINLGTMSVGSMMQLLSSTKADPANVDRTVECRLQESLSTSIHDVLSIPSGYRICVSLLDKSGRKKRRSASVEDWSPESGLLEVSFERKAVKQTTPKRSNQTDMHALKAVAANPGTSAKLENSNPVADLVRALDRAESRPGFNFVVLKWFRDSVLMAEGLEWTVSDSMRQEVLRTAIEERLILTSKVPNPKSPQFPVTTIRLNRLLPEVKSILGERPVPVADFQPVAMRGESLSTTILRERR